MERQPETKQPPSKPRKAPKGQLQMRAGGRQAVGVEVDENREGSYPTAENCRAQQGWNHRLRGSRDRNSNCMPVGL